MKFAFVLALTALPTCLSAHGTSNADHVRATSAPVEALVLPDIPVTDKNGETAGIVDRYSDSGILLIGFSYTDCVSLCPITHAILADVDQRLRAPDAPPLTIVTVSIDPLNDTPAKLATTADTLQASPKWQWLVASTADTPALLSAFGITPGPVEAHDPVFLLGDMASGKFRRIVGLPDPEELVTLARTAQ